MSKVSQAFVVVGVGVEGLPVQGMSTLPRRQRGRRNRRHQWVAWHEQVDRKVIFPRRTYFLLLACQGWWVAAGEQAVVVVRDGQETRCSTIYCLGQHVRQKALQRWHI